MPDNNWEKIKEEVVFKGYREIIRRTFRMPDGRLNDYDIRIIGHPVVCMLGVTPDQKFLVAREFRQGPEKILNEIPGGAGEDGETPLEAAKREFLEETGYDGDFQEIGSSWGDAYSDLYRHHFVVTNCKKIADTLTNDDTEFIEVVLLSLDELKDLIKSGELTDSETALRGLIYLGLI